MNKYKLTSESKLVDAGLNRRICVHRIEALQDVYRGTALIAKKGATGGWVQSELNLSQAGGCWVKDDAIAMINSRVHGNATVEDNAIVSGHSNIGEWATISDNAIIRDAARIYGHASVDSGAVVSGNAHAYAYAHVTHAATVTSEARIYGAAKIGGSTKVSGYACIYASLSILCDAVVTGHANISDPHHFTAFSSVGSENSTLTAYRETVTEEELESDDDNPYRIIVNRGCFTGSLEEFVARVETRHGPVEMPDDNRVYWQYQGVINMIRQQFNLVKVTKEGVANVKS